MSSISRSLATEVAVQMTNKTGAEIEKLENQLSDMVEKLIVASLPKEVIAVLKTFPGYIATATGYNVKTGQGKYLYIYLNKAVPAIEGNNTLYVSRADKNKIVKLHNTIGILQAKRRDLKKEIINTLLRLRSSAAIKNQFPEAFEYLPAAAPHKKDALKKSETVDALRLKIKKQP